MAWIIGAVSRAEMKELERRGWEIEEPPLAFLTSEDYEDFHKHEDEVWIMVYVDSDVFKIMSGPDWDKGESDKLSPHLEHAWALEVACYGDHDGGDPSLITVECAKCGSTVATLKEDK